ncbi:MAG: T9SS type A sorting domain-containing protein, partial [Candidatus Cloacimonetes bacterium]|nr:T9SS type A sorting domain-containing protein [Candidatus Cloacimonadota bacterium]
SLLVTLEIYNLKGQKVKTLVNETIPAGEHSVVWNGKDDSGKTVASGIYLCKMRNGKYSAMIKMILMK